MGAEVGVILLLLLLGLEYSASELLGRPARVGPGRPGRPGPQLQPGPARRAAARLVGPGRGGAGRSDLRDLVGDRGQGAGRPEPAREPRDPGDPVRPGHRGPGHGRLPAPAHRGPGRGGLLASALPVGVALAAVALVLLVAVRYGETLSRLVFSPSDEVTLLVVLGLALVVAGVAQQLQVSAAVGAFLVGIALSGRPPRPPTTCSPPCGTCSRPCSSCSSGSRPTPGRSRRWPSPPPPWPWSRRRPRSRLVGGQADRGRPPGALAGRDLAGAEGGVLDRDRRAGRRRRPPGPSWARWPPPTC